jgi:hypothetical protein
MTMLVCGGITCAMLRGGIHDNVAWRKQGCVCGNSGWHLIRCAVTQLPACPPEDLHEEVGGRFTDVSYHWW